MAPRTADTLATPTSCRYQTVMPTPIATTGPSGPPILSRWRDAELFTLEDGVRQITSVPAGVCGLEDRGVIAPGFGADLVLLDLERLDPGTNSIVRTSPRTGSAGAPRWMALRLVVNGRVIVEANQITGQLPGAVLRTLRGHGLRTSQVERSISLPTGNVVVNELGSGPPLVVLHRDVTAPGTSPFLERLAERHTVFAPHFPGFGVSDRPEWMRSVRNSAWRRRML